MGRRWRDDGGSLYRHLRAGRVRAARRPRRDHDVVAGAAVSPTLSEGAPRRIAHHRSLRSARDRRRGAQAPGYGAVVDSAGQPRTRGDDDEVPGRRYSAVAGGLHDTESSGNSTPTPTQHWFFITLTTLSVAARGHMPAV